jgi:hypothetical protein
MGLLHSRGGLLSHFGASGVLPWYLSTGALPVAAYQPKGAASLAASYVNLANPGTYDAAPGVAPTLGANGWAFNGSTQYLTTGITADLSWSILARVTGVNDANGFIFGYYVGAASAFGVRPRYLNNRAYFNGLTLSVSGGITSGVVGFAGKAAYLDGAADGTIGAGGAANAYTVEIGRSNGTANLYLSATVVALAIYSTTLSAGNVATLTTRMAAL